MNLNWKTPGLQNEVTQLRASPLWLTSSSSSLSSLKTYQNTPPWSLIKVQVYDIFFLFFSFFTYYLLFISCLISVTLHNIVYMNRIFIFSAIYSDQFIRWIFWNWNNVLPSLEVRDLSVLHHCTAFDATNQSFCNDRKTSIYWNQKKYGAKRRI